MVEEENAWAVERFDYGRLELEKEPSRWAIRAAYVRDLLRAFVYGARFAPGIRKYVRRTMTAREAQRFFFNLNPRAWKLYPGYSLPDPPDWRTDDPRIWRGGEGEQVLVAQRPVPAPQQPQTRPQAAPEATPRSHG